VEREDTLDTDAKAHLTDGDAFARATVLARDDYAFENLQTFFVAFLDSDVDFDGITGLERRDIFS